MSDLPPLAWVAICAVIVILIIMNLALVALVRHRRELKITTKPSRSAQSWQKMNDLVNAMRDPFAKERKQLNELSGLVHDLEKDKDSDSDNQS